MKNTLLILVGIILFGLGLSENASAQTTYLYTVKQGDTMWKIAVSQQVGVTEIIEANPRISNPNRIYPGQKINIPNYDYVKQMEHQVIQLTNQERAKFGLAPLRPNWELSRVARFKSQDMRDRNYFSHQSPIYGSPFQMMKSFGLGYSYAAENIAAGQKDPRSVVEGWMNSPGHRANILNANLKEIGVGWASGGQWGNYWTQMFIAR